MFFQICLVSSYNGYITSARTKLGVLPRFVEVGVRERALYEGAGEG